MKQPQPGRPHIPEYGIPADLNGALSWEYVDQKMLASKHYWIATVDEHNHPHVTPVWGIWMEGKLYFDGSPQTRRGRNLAANASVAVHLESGVEVVILHGEAHEIKNPDMAFRQRLSAAYTEKYKEKNYAPPPETWEHGGVYCMVPKKGFAWSDFPQDATRWQLEK